MNRFSKYDFLHFHSKHKLKYPNSLKLRWRCAIHATEPVAETEKLHSVGNNVRKKLLILLEVWGFFSSLWLFLVTASGAIMTQMMQGQVPGSDVTSLGREAFLHAIA